MLKNRTSQALACVGSQCPAFPARPSHAGKLALWLLTALPQAASAHSGPPVELFAGFVPLLAYLIFVTVWLKHQTRLPLWLTLVVAAGLFVALGAVAFFLPGLLPVSDQHYGMASLVLNGALTLVLIGATAKLLIARRKRYLNSIRCRASAASPKGRHHARGRR